MIITQVQRFVYGMVALIFSTIFVMVLLNLYALDVFLLLMVIEFLVLVEVTKPTFAASWRKNVTVVAIVCLIIFAAIVVQRTASFF